MTGSLTDDAKVEDGDRGRIRNTLKQLREEENEEYEARALPEAMEQTEAYARASETKQRLYRSPRSTCAHETEDLEDHRTSVTNLGK